MTIIIYKHTNRVNGKAYIGQTVDMARREWFHRNTTHCPVFHAAIQKHGWDQFTTEVLLTCDTYEEANIHELRLIAEHQTLIPNGYNLREGGNNSSPSPETRARMSAAARGRVVSEETKRKISEAGKRLRSTPEYKEAQRLRRLGTKHSEDRKRKISESLTGRTGRKRTDEERKHQSNIRKGVPRPTAQCAHCGLIASTTNIKRWHGDKCSKNPV